MPHRSQIWSNRYQNCRSLAIHKGMVHQPGLQADKGSPAACRVESVSIAWFRCMSATLKLNDATRDLANSKGTEVHQPALQKARLLRSQQTPNRLDTPHEKYQAQNL